jgi:hypothetical protein
MHQGACTGREVDLATSLRAFRLLPVGVAVLQLVDPRDVGSLRLIGANQAAERELRAPIGLAVGKSVAEAFPQFLETPAAELYRRVALSGEPDTVGEFTYQDHRIPEGVFWIDCFPLPDRCVGVAIENITERKRATQGQSQALQLLHRVTLSLSEAPTVLKAAQFCVDEVCAHIDWPVGRFFLSDEANPSRFLPNPVWHFSDPRHFRAFRKATELFEADLTNKLTLAHRTIQGRKAGLARSVGFSVAENDFLHGVLEFSSEDSAKLDEHLFRAISNIGYQLGQIFARERLARECRRAEKRSGSPGERRRTASSILFSGPGSVSNVVEVFEANKRAHEAIANSSKEVLESMREMQQHLADSKRIIARPTAFRPNPGSKPS